MARLKIIYLLLFTYICIEASHGSNQFELTSTSLKPPDKLTLRKSTPYNHREQSEPQTKSFMSKLASWIFPFGSSESATDSTPAGAQRGNFQYLPPPNQYQNHANIGCNPCNREPWIPVASNLGQNTIFSFLQPSSQFGNLIKPQINHPPLPQYGQPPQFRPIPQKINYGLPKLPKNNYGPPPLDYMVPPPFKPIKFNYNSALSVTHLKPIQQNYDIPLDMKPPPLDDEHTQNIPKFNYNTPTESFNANNQYLPSPQPSDSYGYPIVNDQLKDYISLVSHLEPIPVASSYVNKPIPLPNLSFGPVLPIRDSQNFKTQSDIDYTPQEDQTNVQVIPSVKVADYLSSIEHPINVIQSPLVEVQVKDQNQDVNDNSNEKLSENPIVVEDTHTAASVVNISYQKANETSTNSNDGHSVNNKRGNDQDLKIASFDKIGLNNNLDQTESFRSQSNDYIKQILHDQSIFEESKIIDIPEESPKNKSNTLFTPPPIDYSNWEPSFSGSITTSMLPPPVGQSTWISYQPSSTTKKPKQVQIIIPYITNKKPSPFDQNQARKVSTKNVYTTLLPVYTPPLTTEESLWSKFVDDINLAEAKRISATAFAVPTSTPVSNIRDLLKGELIIPDQNSDGQLPFDVISLQNHIDDWTQQQFAKSLTFTSQKDLTSSNKLIPSKKIPNEYFTTNLYSETTVSTDNFNHFDYEPASSNTKESKLIEKNIESNLIFAETATEISSTSTTDDTVSKITTNKSFPSPFSPKGQQSLWDIAQVTVSPITKEKVYIVTPQPSKLSTTPRIAWSLPPKIQNGKMQNQSDSIPKFLIRIDPENVKSREQLNVDNNNNNSSLTVVFSEWPHLINNLQTTTTIKPTLRHPLLGLMDLSAYTPPPNSTVQTIFGHSRVVSVVTPISTFKKENVGSDEKKTTIKTTTSRTFK